MKTRMRIHHHFKGFMRYERCWQCEREGYFDTLSGIFEWLLDFESVLIDKYTRLCFDCLAKLRQEAKNESG